MGSSPISEENNLSKYNENKTIINNSLIQNKNNTFENLNNSDIKNNNIKIKEIQIIQNNKKDEPLTKNINNITDTNLSKNNLEINKNNENLNDQDDSVKESKDLDENLNINFSINNLLQSDEKNKDTNYKSIKINPDLYEFINANDEYYHYDNIDKKIKNESDKNKNLNSKNINNDKHSNKEILSSQRTINISNSDAEFSFDNKNKNIKNNYKNKLKNNKSSSCNKKKIQNKNNFNNKTNIFNNVRVYDLNDSNSNKNKKLSKKDSKKYSKNNKEQEIKKINDKKSIKQNFIRINKSLKKINISSNNLILIPTNNNSKNQLNKTSSYTKKNNIIQKLPSSNNLINNNQINKKKINSINPFRDNDYHKLNKRNINSKSQQHTNKIKNKQTNLFTETSSSNNYSHNFKNFYMCSNSNCNLYEKQKLTELIEKIPNDELKNEIMILYQRIINYNKEVIISNKNNSFDYIITFSNNYIKINDNKFLGKKFDETNFISKNEIKISLNPIIINNINENKDIFIENTIKNNNEKSNMVLMSLSNDSFIKQYTFKDEENDNENLGKTGDVNDIIRSHTKNYINDKIEVNNVNEAWKKIINLNEVIVNKDKIYSYSTLEKNNYTTNANTRETDVSSIKKSKNKIKRYYSFNNKENSKSNDSLKKTNSSKSICKVYRSKSKNSTFKTNKIYNICLSNEKILFEKNVNKLKKVDELIKNINSAKNKNKGFKEDNLIMFSVICLLSNIHFIIFKDKESIYPLIKKKLNLIRKVSVLKRSNNFILIIKFDNYDEKINNEINKNINNKDIHSKENNIGILINKKSYYNEFIKVIKQLISNLEVEYLN